MSEAERLLNDFVALFNNGLLEIEDVDQLIDKQRGLIAENTENCRIIAMSAEREARLLARIAELEKGQK